MKENKLLKILIIVVVALLVFAIIGKKAGLFGKEVLIKVSVEKSSYNPVTEAVTANGKVEPEKEVKISPDVSGEIVDLYVKEGDHVEKGTLLFKIKPEMYVSAKERASAALNSSLAMLSQVEAQLIQAELSYKRNKQLWDEKTISEAEYEQAEAQYKIAKAEKQNAEFSVKSAEASLKEANEQLIKTTIYSPMAGTVSSLSVEQGERVVGANMMSGTEVLRVADLNRMEVNVDVNENDIIHVKLGDTAIVEIDAYLDRDFKGIVTEIANSAESAVTSADQVTNFTVKVLILQDSYKDLISDGNPSPFRPGMSASVDILTFKKDSVLTVPIQSVTTRSDTTMTGEKVSETTRTLVFVSDGKFAIARDVTTGIQDNNNIEIVSGLKGGEDVISQPFSAISKKLSDSTLIEVVAKDKLFDTGKKKK